MEARQGRIMPSESRKMKRGNEKKHKPVVRFRTLLRNTHEEEVPTHKMTFQSRTTLDEY